MSGSETASIVSVDEQSGVVIARIQCPTVGDRESGVIQAEMLEHIGAGKSRVALDFSRVTMLPSVGLGMLIKLSSASKAAKGKLAIFGLDANLLKLMKVSALDRLLVITDSEPKAIKKVS